MRKTLAYQSDNSRSKDLFLRAQQVMPGGNTRHSTAINPYPVYVSYGKGSRIIDVEGEARIDFLNNFTSLILGHSDDEVVKAVNRQIELGTAFTMPTEMDLELAELLTQRVGYIDQIRFCNSGSEAIMLGIKAARAYTGRSKIAKFEGAFHGLYDYVQVSDSPDPKHWGNGDAPLGCKQDGMPASVVDEVVVLPWNNFNACKELLEQNKKNLAAIIVDPLPSGIGMISPAPGFMHFLRECTEKLGILMISDEVMSFRLSYYGAMHRYGIEPDLTAMGKIIGGGFPIGAISGDANIMAVFDHKKGSRVYHSGTFNANPVSVTAGLHTLRQMTLSAYEHLSHMGSYIRNQIEAKLSSRKINVRVCGEGSLFMVHLTDKPLIDYRSLQSMNGGKSVFGELCHKMLARGIVTSPHSIFGCLSTPMTMTDLDQFAEALLDSVGSLT